MSGFHDRRVRLAEQLPALGVEAFLVTRLPNVRYLTGFTGSNGQVVMTGSDTVFLTDGRYVNQSEREVPDLDRRAYQGEFGETFRHIVAALGATRVGFEAAGLTVQQHRSLTMPGVELVPTTGLVEQGRWVKDVHERELLRAAQAIADEAFDVVTGKLAEGMMEQEVGLELDLAMRRAGAEGSAFETIVAFGESAAEPHHRPTTRRLARGDVIKLDFGCIVGGYHSDMTRTIAFGEPPAELMRVYDVVRRAQEAGVKAVRAGAVGGDVDLAARSVISEAGYGDRYTHSLGHGVGLEVHEGPNLRSAGADVLPAGSVVTVEPGVYIPGIGGVRIEDMVEVEDGGARVVPGVSKELLVL